MLALSQTSGYAILALSCLDDSEQHWVLAKDIVACTGVPGPYLSKILHALAKAGVIRAKRGYRGGFMLSRPAHQISVAEVAEAVDGKAWLSGCLMGLAECTDERACPTHTFWKAERGRIRAHLTKLMLQDVADFARRRNRTLACNVLGHPPSKPGLEQAALATRVGVLTGRVGKKEKRGRTRRTT